MVKHWIVPWLHVFMVWISQICNFDSIDLKSMQAENLSYVVPPSSRSTNYIALRFCNSSTNSTVRIVKQSTLFYIDIKYFFLVFFVGHHFSSNFLNNFSLDGSLDSFLIILILLDNLKSFSKCHNYVELISHLCIRVSIIVQLVDICPELRKTLQDLQHHANYVSALYICNFTFLQMLSSLVRL